MAHHIEEKMRFNVSAEKVWQVLADFGGAQNWYFAVEKSPLLAGASSGLGAKRMCNFYDGTSVVEEIVKYKEGEGYSVKITEFSMPMKSIFAGNKVEAIDEKSCEISIHMDFVVKGGPLGWLMGAFVIKPVMKGLTKKMMKGIAYHAATGKVIGNELPSKEQLALAFGG